MSQKCNILENDTDNDIYEAAEQKQYPSLEGDLSYHLCHIRQMNLPIRINTNIKHVQRLLRASSAS
jgi:hypothetical protein